MVAYSSHQECIYSKPLHALRIAGLRLIKVAVDRVGSVRTHTEKEQLALEAILPHKEAILKLVRKSLQDPEASVTAASSSILQRMSWWP